MAVGIEGVGGLEADDARRARQLRHVAAAWSKTVAAAAQASAAVAALARTGSGRAAAKRASVSRAAARRARRSGSHRPPALRGRRRRRGAPDRRTGAERSQPLPCSRRDRARIAGLVGLELGVGGGRQARGFDGVAGAGAARPRGRRRAPARRARADPRRPARRRPRTESTGQPPVPDSARRRTRAAGIIPAGSAAGAADVAVIGSGAARRARRRERLVAGATSCVGCGSAGSVLASSTVSASGFRSRSGRARARSRRASLRATCPGRLRLVVVAGRVGVAVEQADRHFSPWPPASRRASARSRVVSSRLRYCLTGPPRRHALGMVSRRMRSGSRRRSSKTSGV